MVEAAEVQEAEATFLSSLRGPVRRVPTRGIPLDKVAAITRDIHAADPYAAPDDGRKKWGGIYHGDTSTTGQGLEELQSQVTSQYNSTNALYPGLWPSIQKFEAEIIAMALDLLNGDSASVCGLLTSGGTESILLPILGYREVAKGRGISSPEIICGVTAHPALAKACFYFGIKLVVLPVDPATQRLTVEAVKAATTASTAAIYASAPNFPNGMVDPIEELGAWALQQGCGLHVDNCLGGFYLSFAQRAGLLSDIRWNFSVPGVSSISLDIHKYGMAPKGVSVVGFATAELRRATFHPVTNLLGSYVTPTLQVGPSRIICRAYIHIYIYVRHNCRTHYTFLFHCLRIP